MNSPYENLPAGRFWKTGVYGQDWSRITDLYRKKFPIARSSKIMTAGSCFAQNIGRYLRANNFTVMDMEPPPPGMTAEDAKAFGYLLYTGRYGNIYTAAQLLQMMKESMGRFTPIDAIWEKNGRYYDALRPNVEPRGLASPEEVAAQRKDHLMRVRKGFKTADVFIFTLGLTEAWVHRESGTVYPTAPGTIAGQFDPAIHAFKNFNFVEIVRDFMQFRRLIRRMQPKIRFLLTVSPVPLTATASDSHVLAATIYSKSVLRAAAGHLATLFEDVDYFPSYELIASPFAGNFYEPNLRSVSAEGVDTVMKIFFREHGGDGVQAETERPVAAAASPPPAQKSEEDVVCEDLLLEAFAR